MAQEASWRAGGRSKPGKNKSHHNTPRRHQQHIQKIKNAVKHFKDRPVEGGFLMGNFPEFVAGQERHLTAIASNI